MKSKEVSVERRCSFVALGLWIGPQRCHERLRIGWVQQALLDDVLTLEDLCWIQRWAALLPELVADFEDFDQSHLATKLRAKLRLAHGPDPENSASR